MAGKSDEGVSIDVNRLHVICPVRLKRLQFDEMYPCQFEDTELNFCLTSHGTVSCYLRGLDELDVISFVDDSFCWVGTSIMMACYARYSSSFITKNLRCAAPSFGNFWNTTNCCPFHRKTTESVWYEPSQWLATIRNVFQRSKSTGTKCIFMSVHPVCNRRACLVFVDISTIVRKG